MAETLALIKRLTLQKELIEEHIEELTLDKISIQRRINELINNADDLSSNNNNTSCRNNSRTTRSSRFSSGFTTPQPIHSEVAHFFGLPIGTSMTRCEVTRMINKYIRENGLDDKENKRNIHPDEKLKALLKITDDNQLTYFNLQRHLSPLFKL
jgi:chromatin remodeling complex protein RSC6